MSEQPPRLDLCCSLPADAQAVHTDLFDLQPVAEQLAPKYEQGMSKYPLGQYRDRIGPTIEIVYHKVVQTP